MPANQRLINQFLDKDLQKLSRFSEHTDTWVLEKVRSIINFENFWGTMKFYSDSKFWKIGSQQWKIFWIAEQNVKRRQKKQQKNIFKELHLKD